MNKFPFAAACVLAFPVACFAQSESEDISKDQKKQIIEQLESIQGATATRKSRLIQAGIAALTPAASSDTEAMNLFERCYKKVEFDDKGKKDKDWREWKSANKDRMSSPVNKKAVRFQIQWALSMLKAGLEPDEKYNPMQYATQGVGLMTEILKDPKLVSEATSPFSGPVVHGAIGKMYELDSCSRNDWPDDIMNPQQVVEGLVLKPCREKQDYEGLRKGWNTLIGLEKTKQDILDKSSRSSAQNTFHIRGDSDTTFIPGNTVENMAWSREVDCFQCGEKMTAANNMLSILKSTKSPSQQEMYVKTLSALLENDNEENKTNVRVMPGFGILIEKNGSRSSNKSGK